MGHMNYTQQDVDTLARTIWGEARGEDLQGQVAVAWVIVNRSRRRGWPDAIGEVCTQPWQFSCWNENDPNLTQLLGTDLGDVSFQKAMHVATGVLLDVYPDYSGGADHYHTPSVAPAWARKLPMTRRIGNHVFYQEKQDD